MPKKGREDLHREATEHWEYDPELEEFDKQLRGNMRYNDAAGHKGLLYGNKGGSNSNAQETVEPSDEETPTGGSSEETKFRSKPEQSLSHLEFDMV